VVKRCQTACISFALVALLASSPAAQAGPSDGTLEGDAARSVRGFFLGVASSLHDATRGKSAARDTLMKWAMMPRFFSEELNTFAARSNEDGKVRDVDFTGFEVDVTLWYGLVPVERVNLFFWMGKRDIRVLKLDRQENNIRRAFGPTGAADWKGPVPQAFGKLADKVLRAAAADRCGSIPLVRPKDVSADGTASRAGKMIEAQAARSMKNCAAIAGMPYNRITWKLGSASGIVTTQKKRKLGFGMQLLAGPDRGVRIYRLTRPLSPQ
jgi:hypothetical protein